MRNLIAILILIPSLAHAGSAETCMSLCKTIEQESGAYSCKVSYQEGIGALMTVTLKKETAKEREKYEFFLARDCFFETGGATLDVYYADKPFYAHCAKTGNRTRVPYLCEKVPTKNGAKQ